MQSKTSDWFETKIRYAKVQEDGSQKNVTEQYVVDALSFSEAEERILDEMKVYISGDYKITAITPASYHEVFFSDNTGDSKWFKAKVDFIIIDEKTEKVKHSKTTYLVQADSLASAVKHINDVMDDSMCDYTSVSAQETKIMDVFKAE